MVGHEGVTTTVRRIRWGTVVSIVAMALVGRPATAWGQSDSLGHRLLPSSGVTGTWVGALAGGAGLGAFAAVYGHAACEGGGCAGQGLVIGAVVGAAAGAFLGQVLGTAFETSARWTPEGWFQGGATWGANGSDANAIGVGGRMAVLARMTPQLAAGFEVSRFSRPVRSDRAICVPGCEWRQGPPIQITGAATSVALVERLGLPITEGFSAYLLMGLGIAHQTSNWAFLDGGTPLPHLVPVPATDTGPYLTAGAGLEIRVSDRISAVGDLRWEPYWGQRNWAGTIGLSWRQGLP